MTTDLITVFCLSILFSWFGQAFPGKKRNALGRFKPNLLGLIIPAAVIILYSGLRKSIGDTGYYIHTFNLDAENNLPAPNIGDESYLFMLFQYILHQMNADYSVFVMICSIITLVPMIWIFYKYSANYSFSIFFFFTMGIYASTLNGIRQYVATGIILLGTGYLFSERKTGFGKYLIIILIASQIHSSALLMIPIYFLCRRKAWSAPALVSVAVGVIALILISMFLPSFLTILEDTSYSLYTNGWFTNGQETGTGLIRVVFNCLPTIFAAVFSKQVRRFGPIADILINISLVHSAIYILAFYNWIFARFAFYTYTFVVLLMALILVAILQSNKYRFLSFMLLAIYIIYFIIDARSNRLNWYESDFFKPNNNMWFSFLYLD